ncbi:hypothetical protein CHS0354_039656 [Potamilus streckersoni]|uniref:Uncharacterized protein n=1 Tax=Potamilus streckersoni TaxID=2493646 RepID=A0AAE0SK34_9BIVA|nr:hypothetical protein CHS0354_039656 [Potamilus streckersoni]
MGVKVETKIITCTLVGDGMVGKTSLALTFMKEKLSEKYVSTVFDNFATGTQSITGDRFTINMFDTAGQQDYEGLRVFTYKESEVIVICYCVVDRESFCSVQDHWILEVQKHLGRANKKPVILVATQVDLRNTNDDNMVTTVSTSEGERLAKYIGAEKFIECSAITKEGVSEVFQNVITCAVKQRKKKSNILKKMFRILTLRLSFRAIWI